MTGHTSDHAHAQVVDTKRYVVHLSHGYVHGNTRVFTETLSTIYHNQVSTIKLYLSLYMLQRNEHEVPL